jgi:hypothetical protein
MVDYSIVIILWGPPQPPKQTKWLSSLTGPALKSALKDIINGGYFKKMKQYKVGKVTITSSSPHSISTTKLPWPKGCKKRGVEFTTCFKMSDVSNFITKSFSKGVWSPDKFKTTTPIYIVITPRGGYCTDEPNSLGAHSTFTWSKNWQVGPVKHGLIVGPVLYAYVGAQSDLNDTIAVATHEIVEAMGKSGGAPKELCDDCATKYGGGVNAGIDSYTVASYFDAKTNQCVAPPSFAKTAK